MITKIQNKPLYASLIAMVLAIALALGGIGTALGAPDNNPNENLNYEITANDSEVLTLIDNCIYYSKYNGDERLDTEYLHFTINDDWSSDQNLWFFDDGIEDETAVTETDDDVIIDLTKLNLKAGDSASFMAEIMLNNHPCPSKTMTISVSENDSSLNEFTSNVAFTLNFRATGIQATGFKDYKEAFAALNGN